MFRLDSYHYIGTDQMGQKITEAGITGIFLDSGAFSAFTRGVEVDILKYCDYIKRFSSCFAHYSVLDAIGDANKTWENQRTMEAQGLHPLPCFHYGEPLEALEHYANNYEYITLGGMVPISNSQLVLWLDDLWERFLTDKQGRAKVKVHGFGLTSLMLMRRYPWFSVDSSSWVQVGGMGNLFTAEYGTIPMSDMSPRAKEFNQHFDNITEAQRVELRKLIEGRGYDIERLRTNHLSRKVFNAESYMRMSYDMRGKDMTFTRTQPALF